MSTPLVSIVIPVRRNESITMTMESLRQQTVQDYEVHVIVDHEARGQSWARNRGAERARGRYLLFSDSDIRWVPSALETFVAVLEASHDGDDGWKIAYAYCDYQFMPPRLMHAGHWDWERLKRGSYISTMSLFDLDLWNGYALTWDEDLRRLEDWELFLRMGEQKLRGAWTGGVLFTTPQKPGISHPGLPGYMTHEAAEAIVRAKHGI